MAAPFRSPTARVQPLDKPIGSAGGRYGIRVRSGLLTVVAAKTTTAGHVASLRNPTGSLKTICLERIALEFENVTDFTAFQRLGFAAFVARAFTTAYTGGTDATLTTNQAKKKTTYPTCSAQVRFPTTGELTHVAATLDLQPFMGAEGQAASDGATIEATPMKAEWTEKGSGSPIYLAADEGIVVANMVLMGAAGTVALAVDLEWREVLTAELETA